MNGFKKTKKLIFILLIVLTILDVFLLLKHKNDNNYLLDLSKKIVSPQNPPSEKTIKFLKYIREGVPSRKNTSYFWLPMFRFLQPTARQVTETGGYCGDKSRLLIVLLQLNGIQASKMMLYDGKRKAPRHSVVQVDIENHQKMVVDSYYGIYFPKESSGYYYINDLKNDESILYSRIKNLKDEGDRYEPKLSNYPFHIYIYAHPKTINWYEPSHLEILYKTIRFFIGDKVDMLKRPYFMEAPALMIFYTSLLIKLIFTVPIVLKAYKSKSLE